MRSVCSELRLEAPGGDWYCWVMNQKAGDWHEFAWGGISLEVPGDWNLSAHGSENGVTSVTMEDDFEVRLQAEWFTPDRTIRGERLKKRYDNHVLEFGRKAQETTPLSSLPPDWFGHLYLMKDARRLAVLFHALADGRLAFLALIHFPAKQDGDAPDVAGHLITSFKIHDGASVPWRFYDVSFELHAGFSLSSTQFVSGRKHMVFEWKLRKLSMWFFSLAEQLLKGQPADKWVVEFLNKHSGLQGPFFAIDHKNGHIVAKRSKFYPLGHFEELGRRCLRYYVKYRHDTERNAIIIEVFNFRDAADLVMIGATPSLP